MKKKYLLTILIMLVAIILGLFVGYYILFYMTLPPKMQLVGDSEFLINHLLEKEKLETFISTSKVEEIENGENTDLYIVVLIANYNIENQVLKLNNFYTKLYKITYKERRSY